MSEIVRQQWLKFVCTGVLNKRILNPSLYRIIGNLQQPLASQEKSVELYCGISSAAPPWGLVKVYVRGC